MNIEYTIPTDEQVAEIERAAETRNSWTSIYDALAEHGRVIIPEMSDKMRNAIYTHYRNTRRKVRFTRIADSDSYLLTLVTRNV